MPLEVLYNNLGSVSECIVIFKWVMKIWNQLEAGFHLQFIRRPSHNETDISRSQEGFLKRKFCKLLIGFG